MVGQDQIDSERKRLKMMSRMGLDPEEQISRNGTGFAGKMGATLRSGKELGQSITTGIEEKLKHKKKRKNVICCGLFQRRSRKKFGGVCMQSVHGV